MLINKYSNVILISHSSKCILNIILKSVTKRYNQRRRTSKNQQI